MNIADVSPEADTALLAEAKALRDGVHLLCAMAAANDDSALRASVIDQSAGYLYSFMYNLFAGTLEEAPVWLPTAGAVREEARKCLDGLHATHADACRLDA